MKINGLPGEVGFKALFRFQPNGGWMLSEHYYFNLDEVTEYERVWGATEHKWPVDVQADERVYVPTIEELTEGV